MREKHRDLIVVLMAMIAIGFLSFSLGSNLTESRLEKMAKETGVIFIKDQPYKVTPVKETLIEIKK